MKRYITPFLLGCIFTALTWEQIGRNQSTADAQLPQETATLIQFLRPGADPLDDYSVSSRAGVITIDSYDPVGAGGPQPTQQELDDAFADLTTVDHGDGAETYSAWKAKRGGNVTITKRWNARRHLDLDDRLVLRALALVVMDEINILRGREGLALRNKSQIITAVRNKIDSGDSD